MHIEKTFTPADLFDKRSAAASLFSLSIRAAIGSMFADGGAGGFSLLESDGHCIAFYMADDLVRSAMPPLKDSPHVLIKLIESHPERLEPARCVIELERVLLTNGIGLSASIVINLPDRILGLENIRSRDSKSDYCGVLFNTTKGEYRGNVFDLIKLAGSAVGETLLEIQRIGVATSKQAVTQ